MPRRSSTLSSKHDPIVAPGFGTRKDLARLARDLSSTADRSTTNTNSTTTNASSLRLPIEAIQALMDAKGRGLSRRSQAAAATAPATPVSSAWADFMKEEGVGGHEASADPTSVSSRKRKPTSSATKEASSLTKIKTTKTAVSNDGTATDHRVYTFDHVTDGPARALTSSSPDPAVLTGVLVQAGTLDAAVVGRTKKFDWTDDHCLTVPTRLGETLVVSHVYTAGHATHSLARTADGRLYGWGRNESQQLGSHLPTNVYRPTPLDDPPDTTTTSASSLPREGRVVMAATGKAHTLVLYEDGTVYAIGSNKLGQCGVKSSTDHVPKFRACVLDDRCTGKIIQIACGEEFSVAVCDEGYMYTCGSGEFGHLGNGATGEHFIAANKIAFANDTYFVRRTTFCHAPTEKLHTNSDKNTKVIPLINDDVRIQQVACGKHHTLALECNSDDGRLPRVFSFGCGDYGVLGHGIQQDEYYPRMVGTLANLRLPATGSQSMQLVAGQHCSLLLTVHGHVYYWGKHRSVGEATMRPTLVDVLANNGHVVTHAAAGGQTVVCSTANGQTVAWGQGPHGELGLAEKKSSAKPTFVPGLDACRVVSLVGGYGHTLWIVRRDDAQDKAAVESMAAIDVAAVAEGLAAAKG